MWGKLIPVLTKVIGIFGSKLKGNTELKKSLSRVLVWVFSALLLIVVVSALAMNFRGDNLGSYWFDLIDVLVSVLVSALSV